MKGGSILEGYGEGIEKETAGKNEWQQLVQRVTNGGRFFARNKFAELLEVQVKGFM